MSSSFPGFSLVACLFLVSCLAPPVRDPVRSPERGALAPAVLRHAQAADKSAASTPHAGSHSSISCDALALEAALRHPKLAAQRSRAQASLARSRSERSLASPNVAFEIWDFPIGDPSRANREGMYMFSVGQTFSFPSVREAKVRAESEDARAMLAMRSDGARMLWAGLAHACVDWSSATLILSRYQAHRDLLRQVRDVAVVRFASNAESLGPLARMEAEVSVADRHVGEARAAIEVTRDTFAAMAALPELPSSAPPLRNRVGALDLEEIVRAALASRGDVRAAAARHAAYTAKQAAIRAEARTPMIDVRATYGYTPGMRAGLGAMVGLSLPWLWGGGGDREEAARLDAAAAHTDTIDVARAVRAEVTRAARQVDLMRTSLDLLLTKEIPAATRAHDAERASMMGGDLNLLAWISAVHAVRNGHIDEAKMRGALAHAWVELDAAVGLIVAGTKEAVR